MQIKFQIVIFHPQGGMACDKVSDYHSPVEKVSVNYIHTLIGGVMMESILPNEVKMFSVSMKFL